MVNVHVLIPSYNCSNWIDRCLESVASQSHKPASVLVIDDASTEVGYEQKTRALCDGLGYDFLRNETNMKCPYNLKFGVDNIDAKEDDVIFLLDGDDFLPSHALERIAEVYGNPDVWMTYGNYEPKPYNTGQTLASAYPIRTIRTNSYRTAPSYFNHPITFRRFLWDGIEDHDLQNNNGEWFRGGYDRVIMIPFFEMCGAKHFRFLNETLYFYNAVNPISDSNVNLDLIHESNQTIRRPKKQRMVR